ncbi:MAG: hypothetical protein JRI23_22860 [Deltaproteobacteria bacterium]|jgi:hypothetical protein|nr:hypothetical protein [Deltaproteobacteria bacterium]MBW2534810.1 hypothetical protein [Deltaproteobacteria bacterium]
MKPTALVTAEVVRKIRDEQAELVRALGHVQELGEQCGERQLGSHLAALRIAFEEHARRVDVLLATLGRPDHRSP